MSLKKPVSELVVILLSAFLGIVCYEMLIARDFDRRFTLYNIQRELRKEMSRAEIESIINRHYAPFVSKQESERGITLLVFLGSTEALILDINIHDGKLFKSSFGGEDNEQDVPKDAPSNLE